MFTTGTFAVSQDEVPGKSVYVTKSEQNEVWDIIQKSDIFIRMFKYEKISL